MNSAVNNDNPELFDGDIGPVKYAFSVPALSLADYCRGSRITLSSLYKKRSNLRRALTLCVIFAATIGLFALIDMIFNRFGISLYMTLFQADSEAESGFQLYWWNISVVALFLYAFLIGYFVMFSMVFRRSQHFQKQFYLNGQSTVSGYYLEIGESGIRSKAENGTASFKWDSVTGITRHKGMTFISIHSISFFWIPDSLEGYDCDAVTAFIKSKLAEPV
ncbi:YcxB family protein [Budvicia diplopodorum]|uniref:YcxB family protein n=1 Tax=Budvicia diplopodorum TaxID=1119056 RepID=UPI001356C05C|nr:YcxB family protein [Budvicia diplopodorum]